MDNYYVIKFGDESFKHEFDTADELFYKVSYVFAFDDCEYSEAEVTEIVCDGRPVRYTGWRPGMCFRYVYEDGSLAWECWRPELDH